MIRILSNYWLALINDFTKVCPNWNDVIRSSNWLFSNESTISCNLWSGEFERFSEAGFISLVKTVHIQNQGAVQKSRDYIDDNSLTKLSFFVDKNWTDESLVVLMDILQLYPKVCSFEAKFKIEDDRMAVWFWNLLIKQVHCNRLPKHIQSTIKIRPTPIMANFSKRVLL